MHNAPVPVEQDATLVLKNLKLKLLREPHPEMLRM